MTRLRHTDEWVGLLVVIAAGLFLAAVLEVGFLQDWFRPAATLRIVLPTTGVSGLSTGADVEVLGIRAGVVRRVVIQPDQQMYAEAAIDEQAQAFIRRDSLVVIRRRFGVAGAAFIDISRGKGPVLDWSYAVLDATTERVPTESIGTLMDEVREKALPILIDFQRLMASMSAISERVEKGEGTIGHLVSSDALSRKIEETLDLLQIEISDVNRVIDEMYAAAKDAHAAAASAAGNDAGLPAILRRTNALLTALQSVTRDVSEATQRLPQVVRNVDAASAELPALMTQIQITAVELEKLSAQLRASWLLGNGGPSPPEPRRVPASNVKP
jgi:phospholipid/cholesterol/gamma-HCH transport system substrate-binding protein